MDTQMQVASGRSKFVPVAQPATLGCSAWVKWILANALGWGVGLALAQGLETTLQRVVTPGDLTTLRVRGTLVAVAAGMLLGICLGLAQVLFLRHHLRRPSLWILATTVSTGLAFGAVILIFGPSIEGTLFAAFAKAGLGGWAVGLVIIGGAFALLQWLCLRAPFRLAVLWILANIIGVLVGFTVGDLAATRSIDTWIGHLRFLRMGFTGEVLLFAMIGTISGVVLGAITGMPLIWTLRHRSRFVEETTNVPASATARDQV